MMLYPLSLQKCINASTPSASLDPGTTLLRFGKGGRTGAGAGTAGAGIGAGVIGGGGKGGRSERTGEPAGLAGRASPPVP